MSTKIMLNKRVLKEIENGYKSNEFDFFFDPDGKYKEPNACYIRFLVKSGTYMGQTHILQIKFTYGGNEIYTFPKNPPNVLFLTPIFHVNISTGGSICLDVIKDNWSPMYGIETIFSSILALLEDPNPSSPFNGDACKFYSDCKKNETPELYKKICQEYYLTKLKGSEIAKMLRSSDFKKTLINQVEEVHGDHKQETQQESQPGIFNSQSHDFINS